MRSSSSSSCCEAGTFFASRSSTIRRNSAASPSRMASVKKKGVSSLYSLVYTKILIQAKLHVPVACYFMCRIVQVHMYNLIQPNNGSVTDIASMQIMMSHNQAFTQYLYMILTVAATISLPDTCIFDIKFVRLSCFFNCENMIRQIEKVTIYDFSFVKYCPSKISMATPSWMACRSSVGYL